ncbi:MAG: hypothetical protein IPJ65_22515 [Archangiaceae bacterium]|nr:hypothetical protein [Archangiaceae bacterium]
MTLDEFKKKVDDYLTNNVTAMLGNIKLTSNERADLKVDLATLDAPSQQAATAYLKSKGIAQL